jgi:AcrR family transcriptional regulator
MSLKVRPRTKPREQRRDELMNAAQKLFLRQGVGPTTIEQIASGAQVAKGTFYLHFESKDDLLAALGERFARHHLAAITAAIDTRCEQDWAGRLATWIDSSVCFHLDSIQTHDMLFYESGAPTRQGLVDNIVIDDLSELLRAGATAGAWSIDDPRLGAVFLFSGLHGIVDDASLKQEPMIRDLLVARLQRICFGVVQITGDFSSA